MTILPTLRRILRHFRTVRPVVNTYKTAKTDLEKKRAERHRQLAAELGLPWPLHNAGRE